GFGLAHALRTLYPNDWKPEKVNVLLADDAAQKAIQYGKTPDEAAALWRDELAAFLAVRERYLVYPGAD
ncbi:MAG: DUF1343 domain-containing protein, partial [Thermoleophilia bacterium]|nr:DUF1343 domain-containing protein [Thermoleophilia bacterium]